MTYEEIDKALYEKYILLTEYYDSDVLRKCHLTRNKKYLTKEIPKDFDTLTDANYVYNLDLERYEKIPCHKIDIIHHLPYNKIKASSFLHYINYDNIKLIDEINDEVYKKINDKIDLFKKSVNIAKTFTTLKDSNIEIYKKLFCSEIINEHNCCFSLIFEILPEQYKKGDIDIKKIKNKFNEILNIYKEKALKNLDSELDELDDDEIEEINVIKQMIKDSVYETIEKYKNSTNLVDIFEDWPTILLPAPEFISDQINDTSYQDCLWAFSKEKQ
tara:strand:+ start:1459 stop:2277 length:819 start_codon:yes stop_codon:yes gene_type:complete